MLGKVKKMARAKSSVHIKQRVLHYSQVPNKPGGPNRRGQKNSEIINGGQTKRGVGI